MSFTGYPLSVAKTMQIKLAAALLARPKVLVLSPLYDMVPVKWMNKVLDHLRGGETSVLYFSNRPEEIRPDAYLWIGRQEQRIVADWDSFQSLRYVGLGDDA
jgi:putative ABC transport system ATP-binding protein